MPAGASHGNPLAPKDSGERLQCRLGRPAPLKKAGKIIGLAELLNAQLDHSDRSTRKRSLGSFSATSPPSPRRDDVALRLLDRVHLAISGNSKATDRHLHQAFGYIADHLAPKVTVRSLFDEVVEFEHVGGICGPGWR